MIDQFATVRAVQMQIYNLMGGLGRDFITPTHLQHTKWNSWSCNSNHVRGVSTACVPGLLSTETGDRNW